VRANKSIARAMRESARRRFRRPKAQLFSAGTPHKWYINTGIA